MTTSIVTKNRVFRGVVIGLAALGCLALSLALSSAGPSMGKEGTVGDKTDKTAQVGKSGVGKTDEEWQHCLSPEAYKVMREKGTEMPFTGKYYRSEETGIYHCAACGNPLFGSDTKFDSGTGWPSFFQPVSDSAIETKVDKSMGVARTEVLCAKCGSHLGHVFEDGPDPTGLRYCMNSVALDLKAAGQTQLATFAAGCFWGVEAEFRKIKGVVSAAVGYTGGHTQSPAYKDVCSDSTGHAEAIQIEYDPSIVTYDQLLDAFWAMHDPTTPNRQGPDVGSQYRSAIFYHNDDQLKAARASIERLDKSGKLRGRKIVTELVPAGDFYKAEEYHQRYFEKHGFPSCHS
jgi:peptide methionine sulfoxide reductase msrA/msrB